MSTDGYVAGLVSIEDGNPPASGNEYDPRRKVRVEIGYAHEVNADPTPFVDRAASIANAKVQELLGRTVVLADAAPKATRTRAKAADKAPVEENTLPTSEDPFEVAAPETPEVAAKRQALEAELNGGSPAVEDDPFAVIPETPEITDAALNAAVTKKNTEISDAGRIKGLIAKYNPDPTKVFQLREIPQAQRQDFLDKLAELKKAA